MSVDMTVLEDPAADEAYTYLQREHDLTPDALAGFAGISQAEAVAGLRALAAGGLASTDDEETYSLLAADGDPPPAAPGAPGASARVAEDALGAAPSARRPGSVEIPPDVALAMVRGERVRMTVRADVEVVEGKLEVQNLLAIEEIRMPGERASE